MNSEDQRPLAAVLAGGRGSRIGRSKATVMLAGRALIEWPIGVLQSAGLDAVVVAKPGTELPQLDAEVWLEPAEPSHPLVGIVTALERADGRPVIVCACDVPFVAPEAIQQLAAAAEPLVVLRTQQRLQPLVGRYEPELLEQLRESLAAESSMHEAIERLGPRAIEVPERMLFNVNTRDDLEQAERMLA